VDDSYKMVRLFSAFILPMEKKIKNLKISVESHQVLKTYCDKRGIKMYKFLENLILEKCSEKKDIYGEL
jgi:hypothetical protein